MPEALRPDAGRSGLDRIRSRLWHNARFWGLLFPLSQEEKAAAVASVDVAGLQGGSTPFTSEPTPAPTPPLPAAARPTSGAAKMEEVTAKKAPTLSDPSERLWSCMLMVALGLVGAVFVL